MTASAGFNTTGKLKGVWGPSRGSSLSVGGNIKTGIDRRGELQTLVHGELGVFAFRADQCAGHLFCDLIAEPQGNIIERHHDGAPQLA